MEITTDYDVDIYEDDADDTFGIDISAIEAEWDDLPRFQVIRNKPRERAWNE